MRKFLLAAMLLLCVRAAAYDIRENGICYNLDRFTNTAEVTYADLDRNDTAYVGSVSIPSSVIYNATEYRVTRIGERAFAGCTRLNDVTIPQTVKLMGLRVFAGCENLVSVTLPDTLRHLPDLTFSGCESLGGVKLPDSLRTIGNQAFENCKALGAVEFPDSLESIGPSAFAGCASLPEVLLPNSLQTIETFAFSGCTGLKFMRLGKNLKRAGVYAFNNLTSLTELECWAHTPPAALGAFSGVDYDRVTLYVPAGCGDEYAATQPWSLFYHRSEIDPAGIRAPEAAGRAPVYYDLGGRLTTRPDRGVCIERTPDGRTRKILAH